MPATTQMHPEIDEIAGPVDRLLSHGARANMDAPRHLNQATQNP